MARDYGCPGFHSEPFRPHLFNGYFGPRELRNFGPETRKYPSGHCARGIFRLPDMVDAPRRTPASCVPPYRLPGRRHHPARPPDKAWATSAACILVGYAITTRASYRLLTLDTRKVIIRQEVHFDDDMLPLQPGPRPANRPGRSALTPATFSLQPSSSAAIAEPELKVPGGPQEEPGEPQEEPGEPQEEPAPAGGVRRSGRLSSRPESFSPCDYDAAKQHRRHRRALADQALATAIRQEPRLTPTTYAEAMDCDARSGQPNWTNAVEEEMESMADNSAWEEAKVPPGWPTIPAMWVFKQKLGRNGETARYRARLVAKGFRQRPGVHFNDTFAPTLRMDSLRLMLNYCLTHRWDLQQYDVKGAFQIPDLPPEEMVYMKAPPGIKVKPGHALRLLKCIYGLKQSGRRWNQHFNGTVTQMDFKVVDGEDCLYTLTVDGQLHALLAVYVDDILVGAITKEEGQRIAQGLHDAYTITVLGVPKWLLGAEIDYNPTAGTLRISRGLCTAALGALQPRPGEPLRPAGLPRRTPGPPHLHGGGEPDHEPTAVPPGRRCAHVPHDLHPP